MTQTSTLSARPNAFPAFFAWLFRRSGNTQSPAASAAGSGEGSAAAENLPDLLQKGTIRRHSYHFVQSYDFAMRLRPSGQCVTFLVELNQADEQGRKHIEVTVTKCGQTELLRDGDKVLLVTHGSGFSKGYTSIKGDWDS